MQYAVKSAATPHIKHPPVTINIKQWQNRHTLDTARGMQVCVHTRLIHCVSMHTVMLERTSTFHMTYYLADVTYFKTLKTEWRSTTDQTSQVPTMLRTCNFTSCLI
jgi:hypothetical protein